MTDITSGARQVGKTHTMIHEICPELTVESCPLCVEARDRSPTGRLQYPSRPEMQDIPPPGPEHTVYKGGWPRDDH